MEKARQEMGSSKLQGARESERVAQNKAVNIILWEVLKILCEFSQGEHFILSSVYGCLVPVFQPHPQPCLKSN